MRQSDTIYLSVPTPEGMRSAGAALGRALLSHRAEPLVVAIEGELGAGKTTLVSGVIAAAGFRAPVRSPTYTLVEPYEAADRQFYHLDLYRLVDGREVEPLGIRDLLVPAAVLLIEWPSRAAGHLPTPDLTIDIDYLSAPEQGRRLRIVAISPAGAKVLEHFIAVNPQ